MKNRPKNGKPRSLKEWKVFWTSTERHGISGKSTKAINTHSVKLVLFSYFDHSYLTLNSSGAPMLMGSLTEASQLDLEACLKDRDASFGVDHKKKAEARKVLGPVELSPSRFNY